MLLIFDGDCGFCRRSVDFMLARLPASDVRVTPWQTADLDAYGVARRRAETEVLWVDDRGRVYGGAQAIAKLLLHQGPPWSVGGLLLRLPPFRWPAHWVYRLVAANRHRLPGGAPSCSVHNRPTTLAR